MPLFALRSAGQYPLKPDRQAGRRDVPGDEPRILMGDSHAGRVEDCPYWFRIALYLALREIVKNGSTEAD